MNTFMITSIVVLDMLGKFEAGFNLRLDTYKYISKGISILLE